LCIHIFYLLQSEKFGLKGGHDVKPLLSTEDTTFPECGWVNLKMAVFQEGEFASLQLKLFYILSHNQFLMASPQMISKLQTKKLKTFFCCFCGHIQCIETVKCDGHLLFKAKCLSENEKG